MLVELTLIAIANSPWSKLMDFGNSKNDRDDIVFGFADNSGVMLFEIWNGPLRGPAVTVMTNTELNVWYHDVCAITPLNLSASPPTSHITCYVNVDVVNTTGYWPRNIPRENANLAKSNSAPDGFFHGYMDSLRIYDYAMTQDNVICLYRVTRSTPPLTQLSPIYHPAPMNQYSWLRSAAIFHCQL